MAPVSLNHGAFVGEVATTVQTGSSIATLLVDRPEIPVERHRHETAHFCVILKGRYTAVAEGVDNSCGEGTVLFHPPGTTHADRFIDRGGVFLTIALENDRFAEIERLANLPTRSSAAVDPSAALVAWKIEEQIRRADGDSPGVVEDLVDELLGLSCRSIEGGRSAPDWIFRAREMLRDQALGTGSVTGVARAVGVHPVTLTRGFRAHLGTTPSKVVQNFRLNHARGLLAHRPSLSLSQVAFSSGYCDQAQMTRAFRQGFGVPPGQWRRADAQLARR